MATLRDASLTELTAPAATDRVLVSDTGEATYKDKWMALSTWAAAGLTIATPVVQASDANGLSLQDDGGNTALKVLDGGSLATQSYTRRFTFAGTGVASAGTIIRIVAPTNCVALARIWFIERYTGAVTATSQYIADDTWVLSATSTNASSTLFVRTGSVQRRTAVASTDTTNRTWNFKITTAADADVAVGTPNMVVVEIISNTTGAYTVTYAP